MYPKLKLIILGRDGTLNQFRDDHIKEPAEWVAVPGALEAVSRLNHAGWHVVVATNQAGIGRGMIDMSSVNAVHAHMMRILHGLGGRIDAVFFCPHAADANCECRKPNPGMLQEIGRRLNLTLAGVPMVGDGLRDLQAAAAVGAQPVLVLTGKGRRTQKEGGLPEGTRVFPDLAAFVADFLK